MPFRRRYRRRRKYRPRRKRGGLKAKVKSIVTSMSERKIWEVAQAVSNYALASVLTELTAIPEDDIVAGRTGRMVLPTSLQVNGTIRTNNAANSTGTPQAMVRILLVQWFALATPTIGDVLARVTNLYQAIVSPYTSRMQSNSERYTVLADKLFTARSNTGTAVADGGTKVFRLSARRKLKKIYFSGSAANDAVNGRIYLIEVPMEGDNVTSAVFSSSWDSRMRYLDL